MTSSNTSHIMIMVLTGLSVAYFSLFNAYEKRISVSPPTISPTLPIAVLNGIGHSYLRQLLAESLFIKTAVYYGGLNKSIDEQSLHIMSQHFVSISQLHPKLLDLYYRSESVLAHHGNNHTKTTNKILELGRGQLPNKVELPFFEGFNYFHYLNEPLKAANVLRIASDIPDAPQWIGHLASMLMASGGNIRTGLIWLKGMEATSQDKDEKARYKKELLEFEKAMQVQIALNKYVQRIGSYPDNLNDLLTTDIQALPTWKEQFQLEYQPPKLFLRRKSHE